MLQRVVAEIARDVGHVLDMTVAEATALLHTFQWDRAKLMELWWSAAQECALLEEIARALVGRIADAPR